MAWTRFFGKRSTLKDNKARSKIVGKFKQIVICLLNIFKGCMMKKFDVIENILHMMFDLNIKIGQCQKAIKK